jgi:WhiB family redox-sensing transcriptional regulator
MWRSDPTCLGDRITPRTPECRDWRDLAACIGQDPELFFPIGTHGLDRRQTEAAKAVCAQCPVSSECLDWALRTGQAAGIWGGATEDERRALRRRLLRSMQRRQQQ